LQNAHIALLCPEGTLWRVMVVVMVMVVVVVVMVVVLDVDVLWW
jgi:hypothetical protein